MAETLVIQDARLDPDRFILEGVDASAGPHFNVSQLGKFFFARTSFWVRWLEDGFKNVLNGDPECPHSEEITKEDGTKGRQSWLVDGVCSHCGGVQVGMAKTASGYRTYSLADIEQVVHALLANGAINGAQATNALHLVQTMAKIHGLIP